MDRFPFNDRYPAGSGADSGLDVEADDGFAAHAPVAAVGPTLEERTAPSPTVIRIGRVGMSLPAALAAAVLVTTVAFGAAAIRATQAPSDFGGAIAMTDGNGHDRSTNGEEGGSDGVDRLEDPKDGGDVGEAPAVDKPDADGSTDEPKDGEDGRPDGDAGESDKPAGDAGESDKPADDSGDKPDASAKPDEKPVDKPEPSVKPEPKPEPKPSPKPEPKPEPSIVKLELVAKARDDGKVVLDWSAYRGDRFEYYKLVRSRDKDVRWPAGENDTVVGVIGDQKVTEAKDGDAAGGKTWFYRVFAVRHADSGYKVLGASNVARVTTPTHEAKPDPEPSDMALELKVTDAGVVLHWERCGADGFVAYKVVRSKGSNPSYLPGTDGSEVIGVVENADTTSMTDTDVESGETWWYRVQSIGWNGDHKVVLGETAARKVTIP